MKEIDISGKKAPPNQQKIFGANNSFQLGDTSSTVLGGIVEKGFSNNTTLAPSSFPRATVLPFPVARHRSHGPHWAPKDSEMNGVSDDDNGDDDDDGDGQSMAVFAEPVQRKQKKTLDFSRWQELKLTTAGTSIPRKHTTNKLVGKPNQLNNVSEANGRTAVQLERGVIGKKEQDVEMEDVSSSKNGVVVLEQEQDFLDMDSNDMISNLQNQDYSSEQREVRNHNEVELNKHIMSESIPSFDRGYNHLGNAQEAVTISDQIDAENRARLQKMSADEIAEAQAELSKKMNPSLLEKLKKRGQNKSKQQKTSTSDTSISDTSYKVTIPDSMQKLPDNALPVNNTGGSSWDTWSKRVEAVRELRFSLEGDVVDIAGIKSGYSAANVSERDFLRTEGEPAAAGYSIKEALALLRSVVPSQRIFALHLLASVLDKASSCIRQNQVGCTTKYSKSVNRIDWEAIWSFILGPEPELALSLRMSLDDNHNTVVLSCAKVIRSVLCCDINESFFDTAEKTVTYQKGLCTAPVFRSRPKIEDGFLKGGIWKYNTKPLILRPFDDDTMDDKPEGEKTIQDDIVVAGQDLVAGLVRMGIIARIRFLLEMNPSSALEECIISILIAIARHSPTCTDAIMKCERLVQTLVNRFTMKDQMEINSCKIKAVKLVKVLAQSEKYCLEFTKNGTFQKMTWHLYRYTSSIDYWAKTGKENCKFSSNLLVEQLRFWKVCIQYGYCVANFTDLLPALYIWLDVPTFDNLIENNIFDEFAAIAKEAYLVLEALTGRLPNFYSQVELEEIATDNKETWCWSHVGPVVDLALKWIAFKGDPYLSRFFDWKNTNRSNFAMKDQTVGSLLWVISSVMQMLSSLLASVIPEDTSCLHGGHVPWLPDFVPKIGLQIIKHDFFSFSGAANKGYGKNTSRFDSFLEYLCHLRHESEPEMSIAAVVCLNGSIQVLLSVDKLIQLANMHTTPSQGYIFSREDKILASGILKSSLVEMEMVLITFMNLMASEWQCMQSIEMFGRGGPAPGVGIGWGASGGGFWSVVVLLAQVDAAFLVHLLEIFPVVCANQEHSEEMSFVMQRINCAFNMFFVVGPNNRLLMDKLLGYLFQIPVLKCIDLCISRFIHLNKGFKEIEWEYKEEDYQLISDYLTSHFKLRWLSKKKSPAERRNSHVDWKTSKFNLDTIHEDCDAPTMTNHKHNSNSLVVEWAHQRLPLPSHWFLSSLSTVVDNKSAKLSSASNALNCNQNADLLEVAKGGVFLLLGIETMSTFLPSNFHSSIQHLPVSWKLHSLSVSLFDGMGILEDKSRDLYENLQQLYGQLLDNSLFLQDGDMNSLELLRFQSDIHESYSTFVETLVEQFAAVSYGDTIYGRQVAIYLHRSVETPVRLAAWNSLSHSRVLELLPPKEKCIAKVEGYLEPAEDDEKILEAYVKSWTSGALDRAVGRGSVAFTLVLHHLASFIFGNISAGKVTLRNRLVKSLLRDYSGKKQHEGMMMDLIRYNKSSNFQQHGKEFKVPQLCEIGQRFDLLKIACEGSSSLLTEVQKLESVFVK